MTRSKNPTRYGAMVWKPKRSSFGKPWIVEAFYVDSQRPRTSPYHADRRTVITINRRRRSDPLYAKYGGYSIRPCDVFETEAEAWRWAAYKDRALAAELLNAATEAEARANLLDGGP